MTHKSAVTVGTRETAGVREGAQREVDGFWRNGAYHFSSAVDRLIIKFATSCKQMKYRRFFSSSRKLLGFISSRGTPALVRTGERRPPWPSERRTVATSAGLMRILTTERHKKKRTGGRREETRKNDANGIGWAHETKPIDPFCDVYAIRWGGWNKKKRARAHFRLCRATMWPWHS